MTLSATELARYSRHLALNEVGPTGQLRLRAARVLVVGAGGLGSPAALYLAASGIGTLGLVDGDRVDVSNLQRQVLYTTADVGRPKAEAAAERLRALNPEVTIVPHAVELEAANIREIFSGYDVIIDGTDRLAVRYLVNDACVLLGKPLVSAAIYRFEGQAMTYVPGAGPCYRCLFPSAVDGVVANCAEAGVLGVLPGVLGTLQATEAIKLVLGVGEPLVGRLLTYDALDLQVQEFRFARRSDCAVCGDRPSITELRDATPTAATAARDPAGFQRLSPHALHTTLQQPAAQALVDVREPAEFAAGHISGAVNVPVGTLEQRIGELPRDRLPVFICRSGVRSLRAATIAAAAGFSHTAHLEGGMLAWAATVDPSVKVG
jgi:adenylyltransferase/sulfurtransferase